MSEVSEQLEQRPRERQRSSTPAAQSKGPWLWPLLLTGIGVLLLLDNFLLLGDFNVGVLSPLILVIVGAGILLRGDIVPSSESKTFGITRGSVESATLEINAGEIDIEIGALQREGRLIAGQYAPQSRPQLRVDGTHATLKMERSHTPWLFFADWQMGLAQDLPWRLYVSTHIGQVNADLSHLIVEEAAFVTGIGDVRVICPREAMSSLHLRSALGNIHFTLPADYRARITVQRGKLFRVYADVDRYEEIEPGIFVSRSAILRNASSLTLLSDEQYSLIDISISGTFGDAYLS